MSLKLFKCVGGEIVLPSKDLVLIDRIDGGNLVVNPPREIWERLELTPVELTNWSFLVAATGRAMLETLPQLKDGCINYWEAGNWALNEQANPARVFKTAKEYRKVHLHLLGRNPQSKNEFCRWGESPNFPDYSDRLEWAKNNERLTTEECVKIVRRVKNLLAEFYRMKGNQIENSIVCQNCEYPTPLSFTKQQVLCEECG